MTLPSSVSSARKSGSMSGSCHVCATRQREVWLYSDLVTWRYLRIAEYLDEAITMQLSQTGGAVTGTWVATSSTAIAGNVSGTVDQSSFTGNLTLSIRQSAGCSGAFSGSVSASSINWTAVAFTGNCGLGNSANPTRPAFVLQRR